MRLLSICDRPHPQQWSYGIILPRDIIAILVCVRIILWCLLNKKATKGSISQNMPSTLSHTRLISFTNSEDLDLRSHFWIRSPLL